MSTLKDKALAPVKFVQKHRVAIAVVTTTVVCYKIHARALAQHNDFLKEKGLYEEFYTPEDEEV